MYEYIYQTEIAPLSKNSEINEEPTLILPLLSVLPLQITIPEIHIVIYILRMADYKFVYLLLFEKIRLIYI